MPYPNKRGGGGGGARSPVVVSGSPFTNAADLEAWSVLNPHELVNNATNYATAMAGGAGYEWRGDNGVYATNNWFRQNALTTVEQENVDSITDLTLATVPVKGAAGLSDSIATQSGMTRIMVDGELGTTKATLIIGQGQEISEDGGTLRLDDTLEGNSAVPAGTELNQDGTTGANFAMRRHTRTSAVVQPLQTETNVGRWATHVPVTPPTRIIKGLRVRFAQPATGIRFTLRAASSDTDTTGIILFQSHTDSDWNNGAGYSVQESPLGAPVNFSVDIDRSAKAIENTLLYVVVEQNTQGTGDIELRGANLTIGSVTGFFAYLEQDYVLEARDQIALSEDILQSDWNEADEQSSSFILNKPDITPGSGEENVQSDWGESDISSDAFILNKPSLSTVATSGEYSDLLNTPTIPTARTNAEIRTVTEAQLVAGENITIVKSGETLVISSTGGGVTPGPGPNDLYYGLSSSNNPETVVLSTLTNVDPTDPQTVSTGETSANDYFIILTPNTHDITTITDTVLSQDVTDIFTKNSDVRTESGVVYDSYVIGPLNAGSNESYILSFTGV